MRLPPLLLLCLALSLGSPALRSQDGQPPTVTIQGRKLTLGDLEKAAGEARKTLEEVLTRPAEEAPEVLREALKARVEAYEALVRTMRDAASAREEKGRLNKTLSRMRKELAAARSRLEDVEIPEEVSDQDITRRETETTRARAEAVVAEKNLENARAAAQDLRTFAGRAAATIANLEQERERLTAAAAAPGLGQDERRVLETQLLTNELRTRRAELVQQHQADLEALADLRVVFARVARDLAVQKARINERELQLAREKRQQRLKEEQARKEEEARRKQALAERLHSQPAWQAILNLEALLAELQSASKADDLRLSQVKAAVEILKNRSTRLRERFERIKQRLPRGAELTPTKTGYLLEELERLKVRQREVGAQRETMSRIFTSLQETALEERSQVEALEERIADEKARELGQIPADAERIISRNDRYQRRWLRIKQTFKDGVAALRAEGARDVLQEAITRWEKDEAELHRAIRRRLETLAAIEENVAEGRTILEEMQDLLRKRNDHLQKIRFWLRETPFFSGEQRELIDQDLASLRERLPERIGAFWTSLDETPLGRTGVLGGLLALAALGFWLRRVARMLRRPRNAVERTPGASTKTSIEAEILATARTLRILSARIAPGAMPLLPLLLGLGWLAFVALPEDTVARALFHGVLWLEAWMIIGRLPHALYDGDELGPPIFPVAPQTRRRLLSGARLLLPPIFVIGPLRAALAFDGEHVLAEVLLVCLAFLGLVGAVWLTFRQDILRALLPVEGRGVLTRTLRRTVIFFWPPLTLFFVLLFAAYVIGYREASQEVATRALLILAALAVVSIVHQSTRTFLSTLIHRRVVAAEADMTATFNLSQESGLRRLHLLQRLVNAVLLGLMTFATVVVLSRILAISSEDWAELGSTEILPGKGDVPGMRLSDLARGALIFVVGFFLASVLREVLQIGLKQTGKVNQGSRYAISTLTFYGTVVLVAFVSLRAMGLDVGTLGWLLAPAGVALGFGLTEILSNFVSGLILFLERPVQVGDVISVGDIEGDVRKISIRSTIVRTRDGISIIIPNKSLITDSVINWSHGDQRTRLRIPISVAYGSDIALVKKILLDVATREGRVATRPKPEVQFREFGESELSFELLIWLPTPDISVQNRVRSDINSAVDAAFRRAGIEIPFPQRDLHIRSMPRDETLPAAGDDSPPKDAEEQAQG